MNYEVLVAHLSGSFWPDRVRLRTRHVESAYWEPRLIITQS